MTFMWKSLAVPEAYALPTRDITGRWQPTVHLEVHSRAPISPLWERISVSWPTGPFFHILHNMVWVGLILTPYLICRPLWSYVLWGIFPAYHDCLPLGDYYFFKFGLVSEYWPEMKSDMHYGLLISARFSLHCWLIAFYKSIKWRIWEESSNPTISPRGKIAELEVPSIPLWLWTQQ